MVNTVKSKKFDPVPPLTVAPTRLLDYLVSICDEDGFVRIGQKELAEKLKTQSGNISGYLKILVRDGYLERHRRSYKGRYGKTVIPDSYVVNLAIIGDGD